MPPQAEQDLREALDRLCRIIPGRIVIGDVDVGKEAHAARDALLALAARREDGWTFAPPFRGYARLGIGGYLLIHSAASEKPELCIVPATAEEAQGRTVGDLDYSDMGEIGPERIAVRLAFENVAGLDALEQQLRILREVHFPDSVPPAHPAREGREGVQGRKTLVPLPANAEFIGWAVRHETGRFDLDGVSDFGEPTHAEREALNDDTPGAEWVLIYSVREDAASPTPPTGTRTAE